RSRALFWRGWTLQQQGQADLAAATWRQGALFHTFWGQRSADHLAADTVVPRDSAAGAALGQAALRAALTPNPQRQAAADADLLRWAAGWSAPGADVPAPDAVPERLAADPAYQRAQALARVSLDDMATLAFSDLGMQLEGQRDGAALAGWAIQARDA